jgi:hypothetical protein
VKKQIVWSFGAGILIVVLFILLPQKMSHIQDREIRFVGLPDGAAGLLANYVLTEKMSQHSIEAIQFEPYTLYDCCASASQYALGSGRMDIAIMCPDAARALIAKDNRFEIVGPVMMNSDIIIVRSDADLRKPVIAVSQKRIFQQQMVAHRFGETAEAAPMMHTAVPFAYTRGVVQGAVVDIIKSFDLAGTPVNQEDRSQNICTYVLVCKKSLHESVQYQEFMERYADAVRELADSKRLLYILQTYASAHITMGDITTWTKMNVHYTCPLTSPRQG